MILTLYANTVAPWWCCCAVSRASAAFTAESAESSKPSCTAKCCQDSDLKPSQKHNDTPSNQRPCPIQERLILERPSANFERVDLELKNYFAELNQAGPIAFELPVEGPIVQTPSIGTLPTLLMAELRLKFHHAYLC